MPGNISSPIILEILKRECKCMIFKWYTNLGKQDKEKSLPNDIYPSGALGLQNNSEPRKSLS